MKRRFKELLYRTPSIGDLVLLEDSFLEPIDGFVFGIVIGLNEYFVQYKDNSGIHEMILKNKNVYWLEYLDEVELELQKRLQLLYMDSINKNLSENNGGVKK